MATKTCMENPVNLRCLGGLAGYEGRRVRQNRLLRSGEVTNLSPEEIETLLNGYQLRSILDLRGVGERQKSPDLQLTGVSYRSIDILQAVQATSSQKDLSSVADDKMVDGHMKQIYRTMVTDAAATAGFRAVLDSLLQQTEGATLFHCFAGKDRTGVAAAIILTLLGVSRADIFVDYLRTNELRLRANTQLMDEMRRQGAPEGQLAAMQIALNVKREYLDCTYETAEEKFGSFLAFIQTGIGVSDAEIARLRELYLE